MTDKIVRVRCDACALLMPVGATYTDDDGFIACLPSFPVSNRPEDSNRFLRGRCDQNEAPSNSLNLETSNLDPITPEEDALATAIIAAMSRTRQSHDTAVRAIRAGMAKAGAVIVPVEPLKAARDLAMRQTMRARVPECGSFSAIAQNLDAMLSAHSIQSGGEGGEGRWPVYSSSQSC